MRAAAKYVVSFRIGRLQDMKLVFRLLPVIPPLDSAFEIGPRPARREVVHDQNHCRRRLLNNTNKVARLSIQKTKHKGVWVLQGVPTGSAARWGHWSALISDAIEQICHRRS